MKAHTSSQRTRRAVTTLAALASLVAVQAVVGLPDATATFKVYSASVTPQSISAGEPTTLSFTIKNAATSAFKIGSVQVAVPAGYTNVAVGSAATSTGKSWAMRFGTCGVSSPAPCPTPGTLLIQAGAVALDGSDLLSAGKSVTFTVSATAPANAGATTWKTAAKTSRDFSGFGAFVLSGSQPVVTVNPALATSLSVHVSSTTEAGSTLGITASALTSSGAVASGFNNPAAITSSDADALLPADPLFVNGQLSSTVRLNAAGTQTVTVSAGGLSTTVQVAVSPAAADVLLLTGLPGGGAVAGQSFDVTVEARDAFGNLATGYQGSVSFTSDDPTAVPLPTSQPVTDGRATFAIVLTAASAQTLTVTDDNDQELTASAGVTVVPGEPDGLTLLAGPTGPVPAGPLPAVVVGVVDSFGNLTQDSGTQVSVGVTPSGSGLTGNLTVLTDQGSASFNDLSVTKAGAYTLTAAASGLGSASTGLDVVASTASRLLVDSVVDTAGGGQPLQNQSITVRVHAEDAYGNAAQVVADTVVTLSTDKQALGGTTSGTMVAGTGQVTIVGALYPDADNQVTFTASAPSFESGSRLADVQALGVFQAVSPGVPATLQNPLCVEATPAVPTCSTFLLPQGGTGTAYLTQGECNPIQPCRVSQSTGVSALLVSARANFKDAQGQPLYSRTSPATVIIRCDKTLCAGTSIKNFPLYVDVEDNGPFVSAPPCRSKGQIPSSGPSFCIDNVQSKRDNAGDLVQYLLIAVDPRIAPRVT